MPWFTLADVWQLRDGTRKYLGETSERISEIGLRNSAAELLPAGTVVLSRTASVGFSGIMPIPMATSQDFWNWVCGPKLLPEYLLFVFRAMRQEFERLTSGSTHKTIYQPDAASLAVCVPPLNEQQAIVRFLDRETAKLDTLVAKKRELIEKLKEKRTALISRTVTRGLPPDAARAAGIEHQPKLKASGIDWLSDIPMHWEIRRLKFVSPHITVGIVVEPSKYYESEGIPCLRSLNVKANQLLRRDLVFISEESNRLLAKSMLRKGDLVAVRSGQPGTTAVVDEFSDGANCIDLILIRASHGTDSTFLSYFLNSTAAQAQFSEGSGGAIQQHFNIGTAANLRVVAPPLPEQRAIADYLDRETAKIDRMVAKVEEAIERLQEYRSALITAAVTGKIDVRGVGAGLGSAAPVESAAEAPA
jgi:type I restriction enzyme S subunit